MPRRNLGPATVVAVDPGTTSGVVVLSLDPRWLKGQGSASWEGLAKALRFKAAYQVGRDPRTFNVDSGRATKIDKPEGLDTEMLPVLAEEQPLLRGGEFDGRGRRDQSFYAILNGEVGSVGRDPNMNMVDAAEVVQVRQISGLLDNFPEAALVIENFALRPGMKSGREVLSADRLRLAIQSEEMLHGIGRVPFLQMPSEAKSTATDERVKRAGLHFPGMQHATDAARHAATFFRRLRQDEDLRTAAFPRHFKQDWE